MFRTFVLLIPLVWVLGCAGLDTRTFPSLMPGATPKLTRVGDIFVVNVPKVAWTLQFPAGELVSMVIDERPGWAYYGFSHKTLARAVEVTKHGGDLKAAGKDIAHAVDRIFNVSFWIDRADKCNNDAKKCRDNIWAEMKAKYPQMQSVCLWQEGEMYVSEFSLMEKIPKGHYTRNHNMYANFVRDGIWIDFHLSKGPYEEKHRQLFLDFLKSVRFVPVAEK